jgi:hypothetical protein
MNTVHEKGNGASAWHHSLVRKIKLELLENTSYPTKFK